jgi:hypothetical protein
MMMRTYLAASLRRLLRVQGDDARFYAASLRRLLRVQGEDARFYAASYSLTWFLLVLRSGGRG